ncbi:MAG: YcbK family protein [Nannocystaceae bacterium]
MLILDAPAAPSPEMISEFLRCRTTTQRAVVPPELIDRIREAADHFDATKVMIVSGYRAPKFNLSLRKKGRQVAAKSQHTLGHAIDFYLPGVPVRKLYRWLLEHHDGGVGFYPVSEFVHIDTGRKRTWRGT